MAEDTKQAEAPATPKPAAKAPLGRYVDIVRPIGWNERADLAEKAEKLRDDGNAAGALEIVNGLVGSYGHAGWEAHLEPLKEEQAALRKIVEAKKVVEAKEVVEEEETRPARSRKAKGE